MDAVAEGSEQFGDSPAHSLAFGFADLVRAAYLGRPVPVDEVLGGCSLVVSSYLSQCNPRERALLLSSMVDVILQELSSEPDTDLLN